MWAIRHIVVLVVLLAVVRLVCLRKDVRRLLIEGLKSQARCAKKAMKFLYYAGDV
jgi:hypothetical protein